jgi:RHS repeat-associated protein
VVTQSSSDNSPRWLWGGNAANQNPIGLGTFIYNLRYPGQYFQAETGLSYNYFRNYDGVTGRYLESDPIGLSGGINPYTYANDNPIMRTDPYGLFALSFAENWSTVGSIPGGGALIGETFARRVGLDCPCKEDCDGSWALTECSAIVNIDIYLKAAPDHQVALARHDEQQHVDDYRAGLHELIQAGATAESSIKRIKFSSKSDCETSSRNKIAHALGTVLNSIRIESQKTYDEPGPDGRPPLHTH